jgi:hypothetical protein
MGHYRRTGAFGRALWDHAEAANDDGLRAFALGYLSHIGTDTTGHSFVNTICGGPFRTHWQRHHLVENHMDALWYLDDDTGPRSGDQYPQLTESALYYDLAFDERDETAVPRPSYPTGDTMRENWERKRKLDIDSKLPGSISQLLIDAMIDVFYQGGPHPKILRDNDGRPSPELIGEAYRLFFLFLKLTTVDGFSHEPPPPPDVFPNLDFPTISDPSDSPPGDDGGSFWDDLLDFILSVLAVIAYILEVIAYLATLPWAILADILTYPFRLALYYALELPLFHMLKAFRSVLVMTGYMLPMEDEISMGLVRVGAMDKVNFQAVVADIADVFGGISPPRPGEGQLFRDPAYPYIHPDDEFHHPWDYPNYVDPKSPTERCPTTAGPFAFLAGPDALFGDSGQDAGIRDGLESATGPTDADTVDLGVAPDRNLGDPVAFSKYLIWLSTRDPKQRGGAGPELVDWNLDADRGYGYHDWDWNRDPNGNPVDDPEGNGYLPPCTWPPQAGSPPAPGRYQPDTPLKLHWVGPGLGDPGCDGEAVCVTEPVIIFRAGPPGRGGAPRTRARAKAATPRKRSTARTRRGGAR